MFKKSNIVKLAIVLTIAFSLVTDTIGQARIRFARGRTSATISGTVGGKGSRDYLLGVAAGQTMTVRITSTNGAVTANAGTASGKDFTFTLDAGGDVDITVFNNGSRASSFKMIVIIK